MALDSSPRRTYTGRATDEECATAYLDALARERASIERRNPPSTARLAAIDEEIARLTPAGRRKRS